MTNSFGTDGYSATVGLELLVGDETLDVAQTGAGMLMLREPRSLAAGPAVLILTIDGHRERYDIMLNPSPGEPSRKVLFW